ncbi:IL2RB protein, partial [Certhia brachydactyla]|nr:IL2RB protein [Certhia brachydactyla]
MKPLLLLLSHLCLFSLLPPLWASDSAQGASSLICWYDSRAALICDWDPGRDLAEAPCQLEILSKKGFCDSSLELYPSPEKRKKHCKLPKAEHMAGLRRCTKTFNQNVNNQCFTISDRLNLSVHCHTRKNQTKIPVQIKNFSPFSNIKLRPPGNLQLVNITENTSNLTWSLNISSHYLDGMREYQVRYRHVSQSWEEAANLAIEQDQMWTNFERLSPNSKYEAAVRARPSARSNYKGVWSEWSKPVLWRTHTDSKGTSHPVLPVLIVSVFIGIAFFISLWKWFKKILKIHIPDPEKFFPPLVSVHGGDIQKWLSSPFSTSSHCVNSTIPEISILKVMQKNDQESQFLLSKGTLSPDPPIETSVHSGSSCFTNQGYFFFHLSNSFEIEPCQVYFTYEASTQEGSGSKDDECYQTLPSPDLCTLAEDMNELPSNFFHCIEATPGFQKSSFMEETAGEAQQAMDVPGATQSSEGTSPTLVLEQDEKVMDKATSQPAEAVCQLDTDFPDPLDLPDSDTVNVTEESGKEGTSTDPCVPAANATSSFSQPPPLRQRQDEYPCKTAFSSQVPNTGAYLSLRDLQSQYSH